MSKIPPFFFLLDFRYILIFPSFKLATVAHTYELCRKMYINKNN